MKTDTVRSFENALAQFGNGKLFAIRDELQEQRRKARSAEDVNAAKRLIRLVNRELDVRADMAALPSSRRVLATVGVI